MRYLLIDHGCVREQDGETKLRDLQRMVRGRICAAFMAERSDRLGYAVIGYVNDEGFGRLDPNVRDANQTYWGPMVVTGLNPHGGTCGLTDAEVAQIRTTQSDDESLPWLLVDRRA